LQGVFAAAVGIGVFQIFPPLNGRRFNFCHNVIFALPTTGQEFFFYHIPTAAAKTPCNGLHHYTRFAGLRILKAL